jgi:hypothetical protein
MTERVERQAEMAEKTGTNSLKNLLTQEALLKMAGDRSNHSPIDPICKLEE